MQWYGQAFVGNVQSKESVCLQEWLTCVLPVCDYLRITCLYLYLTRALPVLTCKWLAYVEQNCC